MLRSFVSTHTRALFKQRLGFISSAQPVYNRPAQTGQKRSLTIQKLDLDKEIEAITDLATTAKDEMDFAEESRNSVYYNEDKKAAHEAVEEMGRAYDGLLARLSDQDREAVKTRIGIKIKEIQSAYEIMTLNDLE